MKPIINKINNEFNDLLWFFPRENSEELLNLFDITINYIRNNYKDLTSIKKTSFAYIIVELYLNRDFKEIIDLDLITKIIEDVNIVFDDELNIYIESLIMNKSTEQEKHILICKKLIRRYIKNKPICKDQ